MAHFSLNNTQGAADNAAVLDAKESPKMRQGPGMVPGVPIDPGDQFSLDAFATNPANTHADLLLFYQPAGEQEPEVYPIASNVELASLEQGKLFSGTVSRVHTGRDFETEFLGFGLFVRWAPAESMLKVNGSVSPSWAIGDLSMSISDAFPR